MRRRLKWRLRWSRPDAMSVIDYSKPAVKQTIESVTQLLPEVALSIRPIAQLTNDLALAAAAFMPSTDPTSG